MNLPRYRSMLLLAALLSPIAPAVASIPNQPLALEPELSPFDTEDADFDPGVIPNSAVSTSDHCDQLARMEEEFEHGLVTPDLSRVQGPEQHPALGVAGKFRLAVANVSDPFSVTLTAIDSEFGNATGPASPLPR